jgi:hypothetical protein
MIGHNVKKGDVAVKLCANNDNQPDFDACIEDASGMRQNRCWNGDRNEQ